MESRDAFPRVPHQKAIRDVAARSTMPGNHSALSLALALALGPVGGGPVSAAVPLFDASLRTQHAYESHDTREGRRLPNRLWPAANGPDALGPTLDGARGSGARIDAETRTGNESALPSASSISEDGVWQQVPPPPRVFHASAYDPVRRRLVIFGGTDGTDRNDVWTLSLSGEPIWKQLKVQGQPPAPRGLAAMVYDPVQDRMLVYGGGRGDLWELSLAGIPTWREVIASGETPLPRRGASAIYDPVRNRMVIFGGLVGEQWTDEAWAVSLGATPQWTRLDAAGMAPFPRWLHTAIYDAARDRMVVFGGNGSGGDQSNDTHALSFSGAPAWVAIEPSGGLPPRTFLHSAIYDPLRRRMVVYGGKGLFLSQPSPDVWSLSLDDAPTWSRLETSTQPLGRLGHSGVYDAENDQMVIFGGSDSDAWALSLGAGTWTRLTEAPQDRVGSAAVYDPVRDRMLVFGTREIVPPEHYDHFGSLWGLSLSPRPEWRPLDLPNRPVLTGNHPAFYDPVDDRVVVLRGPAGDLGVVPQLTLRGEPSWSLLPASGPVPPDAWITAVFDSRQRRIIGFGFQTWALELNDGPRWVPLWAGNAPPVTQAAAIYDPIRNRMVVFGGSFGPGAAPLSNDVWALNLDGASSWQRLSPVGTPPAAREDATAVYDARRDRMVIFGGWGGAQGALNDVWSLSLDGAGAWRQLGPSGFTPGPRFTAAALYDPGRDRMILFGGERGFAMDDTWFLYWTPPVTPIAIDIRPGNSANALNPNSNGVLPVAILGSHDFRVELADLSTVRLAGAAVQRKRDGRAFAIYSDVNADGIDDLTVQFDVSAMQIGSGTDRIELTGETVDGERFAGEDRVRIVPSARTGAQLAIGGSPTDTTAESDLLVVQTGSERIPVQCTLTTAEAASVELFDLAGRRRANVPVSELGGGIHAIDLRGEPTLTRGVYWLRVRQGQRGRSVRSVILR